MVRTKMMTREAREGKKETKRNAASFDISSQRLPLCPKNKRNGSTISQMIPSTKEVIR
jgi:hypothetical protein